MAICYRCGRQIASWERRQRRKLPTGEWIRYRYPKRRAVAVNTHYGLRLVCSNCARAVDRDRTLAELCRYVDLLFVIVLVLLSLGVWRIQNLGN